jgi:predicted ATPase
MQRIEIENFGAIKNAKIDIKKVLILIGEQASGKSTIAKLIYFFKSLREDLISNIRENTDSKFEVEFYHLIIEKFSDFFGSSFLLQESRITYFYNYKNNKNITLFVKDEKLKLNFSKNFFSNEFIKSQLEIKEVLKEIRNETSFWRKIFSGESGLNQRLLSLVNDVFEIYHNNSLYVVAGRMATVGYSELLQRYFFAETESRISENRRKRIASIDETLMIEFMQRVLEIKSELKLESIVSETISMENSDSKKSILGLTEKMRPILRADYNYKNDEEFIQIQNNQIIQLRHASSGQQEVIRILQDIFFVLEERGTKIFRIIEEPEAHLFPIAQKQLIELMALMVNQSPDNQLIITTHSPYVLTSFNNLLYAHKTAERHVDSAQEVTQVISQDFWLDTTAFSAYAIGNTFDIQAGYCEDIYDEKTGLIQQNYLDTVSEMLGIEFQKLYRINAKNLSKK